MEELSFDTDPLIEYGMDRHCTNTESSTQNGGNKGAKGPVLPAVGMEFEYYDDASKFYSDYAEALGFGIRTHVDDSVITYTVKERINVEGNNRVIREYEVLYDTSKKEVRCICGWFSFKGYLCRHALSVLNHNGVEEIPSQYILSRWRKDVERMFVSDHGSIYVNANNPLQRYDHLYRRVSQIVEEGVISKEHYEVALQALEESLNKVRLVEHVEANVISYQSNMFGDTNLSVAEGIVRPCQTTLQSLEKFCPTSQKTVIDKKRANTYTEGIGDMVNQCFRPIAPKPPYLGNLADCIRLFDVCHCGFEGILWLAVLFRIIVHQEDLWDRNFKDENGGIEPVVGLFCGDV
ncbi:hypothetical protein IFM89_034076, partial [Coptis chinensis]